MTQTPDPSRVDPARVGPAVRIRVLDVDCPTCGVGATEPCRTVTFTPGLSMANAHTDRVRAADVANRAAPVNRPDRSALTPNRPDTELTP